MSALLEATQQTSLMRDMHLVSRFFKRPMHGLLSHLVVKMTLEALDTYNRLGQAYPKYFTLTPDSYAAEKAFKEGRLTHRTEPEIRTHTSYLVFAVLPMEWSEEDEDHCRQRWPSDKAVELQVKPKGK